MTRLTDNRRSYGWISIALHWAGAGLIIAMLFIGNSIRSPDHAAQDEMLKLHTTIGLLFYPVLWARVIWRLRAGHPDPLPLQSRRAFALGKLFHVLLLTAIAVMLVSGPLLAWSGGLPLRLASLTIPGPSGAIPNAFAPLRVVHVAAATVLGWGTVIHVAAVCKHVVIDRDGSFDRMMVAEDDRKARGNLR